MTAKKPITFDRYGKCPICRKSFKSDGCPHDYGYVMRVVDAANNPFRHDVAKLRKRASK